MSDWELLDALCAVTTVLADVVRKQQEVIKMHGIENPMDGEIENAMQELGRAEYAMRRK